MTTISEMLEHLDTLISDYLETRPQAALQINKPLQKEGNHPEVKKLRLEDIYFQYFGQKSIAKIPTLALDLPSAHIQPRFQGSISELPQLPLEVIMNILKFCAVKQLLSFRIVSRSFNELCCRNLQNCYVKPNCSSDDTGKFLSAIENQVQSCCLPFGAFHFVKDNQHVFSILDLIGSQLKLAIFANNDFLFKILAKLPSLQKLVLEETPNFPDIDFQNTVKLHRLQYINFIAQHRRLSEERNLTYFKKWLALAPGLRQIKSEISIEIDSAAELIELFRENGSLRKVSMHEQSAKYVNGKMTMNLRQHRYENKTERYTSRVLVFSNYVKKLSIPYGYSSPLPSLPLVTSIELMLVGDHSNSISIAPGQFPTLRHVTLDNALDSSFFKNYRNLVFFEVDSLTLSNIFWRLDAQEPPIFHLIFPRVKRLALEGPFLCKKYTDYFATHFQGLTSLHFMDIEIISSWNLARPAIERKHGKQWPFPCLKDLKELKITTSYDLQSIVIDIVILTLNKSLQPLDSLTICGTKSHVTNILADMSNLFYSMAPLNYHKYINLDVVHPCR